jgi:hypothetical protein
VIERLTVTLETFQVGEHADDTAALVLRRRPGKTDQAERGEVRETQGTEALAAS